MVCRKGFAFALLAVLAIVQAGDVYAMNAALERHCDMEGSAGCCHAAAAGAAGAMTCCGLGCHHADSSQKVSIERPTSFLPVYSADFPAISLTWFRYPLVPVNRPHPLAPLFLLESALLI